MVNTTRMVVEQLQAHLLRMPLAAVAVWRVRFPGLEKVVGLLGLLLIVFAVALFKLGPEWRQLLHQATNPHPAGHETWATDCCRRRSPREASRFHVVVIVCLALLVIASAAAIPLMIVTKAGQ